MRLTQQTLQLLLVSLQSTLKYKIQTTQQVAYGIKEGMKELSYRLTIINLLQTTIQITSYTSLISKNSLEEALYLEVTLGESL